MLTHIELFRRVHEILPLLTMRIETELNANNNGDNSSQASCK